VRCPLVLRVAVVCAAAVLALPVGSAAAGEISWPSGGHDISNTHSQPAESTINSSNVGRLAPKWMAQLHGDVSAVPAVVGGAVYVPDWGSGSGGFLNKLDAKTGAILWSRSINSYEDPGDGITNAVSRAAPAVVGNRLYLGDQNGGHLFAVDTKTGDLVWRSRVDQTPFAILTAGPLVVNGVIYQGVASSEEGVAVSGGYPCCTFRGSMVAVNASTGRLLWQTYMTPGGADNHPCATQDPATGCGYSGAAIWGTTAAYDPASNTLYTATGNNYTVPDSVKSCQDAHPTSPGQCLDPNDHVDAIVALNASTGQIKWATGTNKFDDWNVACIAGAVPGGSPNNCPANPGPDYDFGSGPNLFTIKNKNGKSQLVVGAGEKSGEYWAVDAATGQILWSQAAGPGSTLGGIEWGPATDGKRIYIAEENFNGLDYAMQPSGQHTTLGSWGAIDPATGTMLWQRPDPTPNFFGGGDALGPVSVANGVVFAPSMSGTRYALDAATGNTLWSFTAPGAVVTGASVVDGNVFWGSGYTHLGLPGWAGSTTFYDFTIDGK
jgi:polyvinyl alcohol dehydrogenase (cytochrome)